MREGGYIKEEGNNRDGEEICTRKEVRNWNGVGGLGFFFVFYPSNVLDIV